MKIMYVKYMNGERHSIIKEGEEIISSSSKIIQFDSITKSKINKSAYTNSLKEKKSENYYNSDNKINEEITNFFFNAIHKNYLSNKNK